MARTAPFSGILRDDVPVAGRSRRLLLVYANTGAGHYASARAVARDLEEQYGATVELVDPSDVSWAHPLLRGIRFYNIIVRWWPALWGVVYRVTNARAIFSIASCIAAAIYSTSLRRKVHDFQPDAVVSFHLLLNRAAGSAAGGRPTGVVITDLGSIHRGWVLPGAQMVIAPTQTARARVRRLGVEPHNAHCLGLPVGNDFIDRRSAALDHAQLRVRYGIGDRFTVLLSGGGEGFGPILRQAKKIVESTDDGVFTVIICGRNKRLLRRARRFAQHHSGRVLALGFVDNMAAWLHAVDLVAVKAGPGTIAEALACGKPIILTGAIPGQEQANVDEVLRRNAGVVAYTPAEVARHVTALRHDTNRLDAMHLAALESDIADTTFRIAGAVIALGGDASDWSETAKRTPTARRVVRAATGVAAAAALVASAMTVGANEAAALGLAGAPTERQPSAIFAGVRLDANELASADLRKKLESEHYSVVLDHDTAMTSTAGFRELQSAGVDIANGGSGQHRRSLMRWRRAGADVTTPPVFANEHAAQSAKLFVPDRRVDGFDLIVSYRHQQPLLVVSDIEANQRATCTFSHPVTFDLRGITPEGAALVLSNVDSECASRGETIKPLRSAIKSHDTNIRGS